jgi:WD40 repeat protein
MPISLKSVKNLILLQRAPKIGYLSSIYLTLMNSPKPRRKRGVILTSPGWEKLQRSIQESEIGDNFGDRYTWEELSDRTRLDPDTIAKVTNRKVNVDKRTLELFFKAFNLELTASDYFQPSNSQPLQKSSYTREDLSEAIDVSFFLGRTAELTQLQKWIVGECRLVALLGMGGIGKTALSVKLAHQIKHKFEYIVWRSLRTAPPIKDLLAGLILFLSNEQLTETALPKTVDARISLLIRYLQNHHCLLILDNLEAILQSGEHTGYYRPGYEDYGELLKRIGEAAHQSCVLITSREKPEELALLEGETLPVRLLHLTGLQQLEAQHILEVKGVFGAESEINKLINYYRGNPLALKIIATSIKELFAGDIFEFFSQSTTVFKGIRQLLEQQINRLSELEKQILYWLAINQEPISIAELQDDFVPSVARRSSLEALESLIRRCLIEQSKDDIRATTFTLQPVVMEYVTDCLVQQVCAEIVGVSEGSGEKKTSSLSPLAPDSSPLLNTHALLKAQAKEYVRDTQTRLILKAVIDKLFTVYYHKNNIEKQLIEILFTIREGLPRQPGYAAGNILNLLCQMETNLSGYDFSYLSVWQAHLAKVNLHNVNFAHADLAKSIFAETFGGVLSVALSQDDKLLATGDSNGEIHIWQVEDGKQLVTCKGHTGWIRSVAFSPDSSMIASGCSDHAVRLWDVRDGKCLRLQEHTNRVRCVVFSPGGNTLASGSDDCSVKLWDVKTGQCLITLQQHTNRVRCVAFNPEGTILASASDDHTVILWNARTGKVLRTLQAHKDGVRSVAFHPGGKILASGGEDKVVRLWDVSTGQCLNTLPGHWDGVWSLTFNPEGNMLASGSHDQTVRLWNINTGQTLKTLQGHTSWVWSVVFAADGQTLVSGGADQTAKLWDVGSGQCIRTWQGRSNGVWAVAFCPVGETYSHKCNPILASVSDDKTVRLWDVSNGQTLRTFSGHSSGVWSIAISPDGQILASGSDDQTVRLWDITTGQALRTLQGHTGWVWSVAFSPGGKILASSGADQTVRLWDVRGGRVLRILQGHTSIVRSVAFSQDGQFLVSGSVDKTVRLWNAKTGEILAVLQAHNRPVSSVSFSPEGRIVASGSDDGTVKLWDVRTGKCIQIQAHTDWIQSVTFSPDGNILASGSHDRTIKLWDVNTGQVLQTLQGHTGWIWSVAFSPRGETLASSSQDGTIKVWDILTGECLKTLRSARPYEGMNITGATSLSVATIATLKALGAVEFENAVDNKIIHISQKPGIKGRSAG